MGMELLLAKLTWIGPIARVCETDWVDQTPDVDPEGVAWTRTMSKPS